MAREVTVAETGEKVDVSTLKPCAECRADGEPWEIDCDQCNPDGMFVEGRKGHWYTG